MADVKKLKIGSTSYDIKDATARAALEDKQDTLTAGTGISIDPDTNVISCTAPGTTYTAGKNITINENNVISAKDTTYLAGENVTITNSAKIAPGYTKVKYVEASGMSYIDTGTKMTANSVLTFVGKGSHTYSGGASGHMVGVCASNYRNALSFITSGTNEAGWLIGSAGYSNNSDLEMETLIINLPTSKAYFNGTLFNITPITPENYNTYLFACNAGDSVVYKMAYGRFQSFKQEDNGVKTYEFVACVRDSDNKPGVYETVAGRFLTCDGLTAGPTAGEDEYYINAVGGGTTYTAGTGIDITNDVISVKSPTLTNRATGVAALTIMGTPATNMSAINIGPSSEAALSAVALGDSAKALGTRTIVVGADAKMANNTIKGSIQLGYGTTNNSGEFNVGLGNDGSQYANYTLLQYGGKIPSERLADSGTTGQVLKKTASGMEWADGGSGSGYTAGTGIDITNNEISAVKGEWEWEGQATDSITFGTNTEKTTDYSGTVLVGYNNQIGYSTADEVTNSTIIGRNNEIYDGSDIVAVGHAIVGGGDSVIAVGKNNTVGGTNVIVIGNDIDTEDSDAQSAIMIGDTAQALEDNAVAIGKNSQATQVQSVAIGNSAKATSSSTIAIGDSASAASGISIGKGSYVRSSALFGVAIGDSAKIEPNGAGSVALGQNAQVIGSNAVQLGGGSNQTSGTLQFKNYQLVNSEGKIPAERMGSSANNGYVLLQTSQGPTWYDPMNTLGERGTNGQFLTTNGETASWTDLELPEPTYDAATKTINL